MKALKLKLAPTREQYQTLDEMFYKWASICTRMSAKNIGKEKFNPPTDTNGIWFSKTQLNQAQTDIKDLKNALKDSEKQKERELWRVQKRNEEILEAVKDDSKKDISPTKPKNFRPKSWVERGFLKAKYHTQNHWQKELEKLKKVIDKKTQTLEKIKRGRIRLKPKRITLHKESFKVSFGSKKLLLKVFHKSKTNSKKLELNIITEPIQPIIGENDGKSSLRSKEFLKANILKFIAYSIWCILLGMSRSEEMLLQAKNPDKILKRDAKLSKKKESFEKKLKKIKRILGREINSSEREILSKEFYGYFGDILNDRKYIHSKEFLSLLESFSEQIFKRNEFISPEKYPILIRKPINRYKVKKIKNLNPEEWKYYIQFSYEPLEINEISQETIIGIDRGLTHLLAVSIFDPRENKFVVNKLIDNPIGGWGGWKRRLKKLRCSIQHLERKIRAQKGIHLHENQMKKEIKSIENRIENLYHNVSIEIIRLAKEKKSAIVLENLERTGMKQHGRKKNKGLRELNYTLSLFDYGKIASLIKYKAEYEGIPMYDILPHYTSQTCAKCLLLDTKDSVYVRDENNKKIGRCIVHGEIDADLNASRVIAVCYHKNLNEPLPFGTRDKRR